MAGKIYVKTTTGVNSKLYIKFSLRKLYLGIEIGRLMRVEHGVKIR